MAAGQFGCVRRPLDRAAEEAWERNVKGSMRFSSGLDDECPEAATLLRMPDRFINKKLDCYGTKAAFDLKLLASGDSRQVLTRVNRSANFGDQLNQPVLIASMEFSRSIKNQMVVLECIVTFNHLNEPSDRATGVKAGYQFNRGLSFYSSETFTENEKLECKWLNQ
ncbi:hypothetical protein Misp06_00477 [Microbulbifer sp. NBRC 101763]|uniref:hypothetical protein n=1 Tax=unclassified Microbulbifer TaxID=2619833 RepID=UPI0030A14A6F